MTRDEMIQLTRELTGRQYTSLPKSFDELQEYTDRVIRAALAEPGWVKAELPPPYVERSPIQAEPPTDWEAVAADQAMTIALMKAEPAQEPVAWMIYTEGGTSAYVTDNPNDLVGAYRALALYTAPPQRKPLTEEEILSVLRLAPPEPSLWPHLKDEAVVGDVQKAVLAIARAIERAHGII